jgi:signal transduction histidine kinase
MGLELRLDARNHRQDCRSDPRVLHVILSNLIGNAIKFTPRGSVTVKLDRTATHHVIEVTDTGQGIAAADQARIFDAFEQLEPAREKQTAGVGLGLALVRDLTASLGGTISVESDLGRGSTFRVRMPVAAPEVASPQPLPPTSSSASGGSLLSQHVQQK